MASRIAAIQRGVFSRDSLWSDNAVLFYLALIVLVGHLLANASYGYQRDEFYYLTCGRHLAWGYVDHPPLTPVMANVSVWLFGNTVFALRFFPALAGALTVLVVGMVTRELGGNRFAQVAAVVSTMMAPLFIAANGLLMPISVDILVWTFSSYLVLRIIKYQQNHLWAVVGLTIGIGLLNKYNVLFFVFALVLGLAIAGPRRVFKSGWFWTGSVLAFLVVLPNLLWQAHHGWATLEFLHNMNRNVMSKISRPMFLVWQVLFLNPCGLLLWLAGLYFYMGTAEGRPYKVFGLIYLIILAFLIAANGKHYYLGAAYPMLFAAAPMGIMNIARQRRLKWDKVRNGYVGLLGAGSLLTFPAALPTLPADSSLRYELGRKWPSYAEILGWDELVAQVRNVYDSLPASERDRAAILTDNYGEAGAVDVLGERYGLPHAISGHNTYYLWGPGDYTGEVCITVGVPDDIVHKMFADVREADRITNHQRIKNLEYGRKIYICHKPRRPLQEMWPLLKHYD
ncbi:MAG TPA: glycosyltransferase family 39 protein [Chthonomonadaceae bacterium]|nr:glycosyltransferase family 39 protein [Chthonomonadaceae bacterium]